MVAIDDILKKTNGVSAREMEQWLLKEMIPFHSFHRRIDGRDTYLDMVELSHEEFSALPNYQDNTGKYFLSRTFTLDHKDKDRLNSQFGEPFSITKEGDIYVATYQISNLESLKPLCHNEFAFEVTHSGKLIETTLIRGVDKLVVQDPSITERQTNEYLARKLEEIR